MKFLRSITNKVEEDTGDAKFDDMMADIKQKGKEAADFQNKVVDAAASVPALFAKQKELEKWARKEMQRIRAIPDTMMQKYKHELAPIADGYKEDTNILELLFFTATNKDPHGYDDAPSEPHEKALRQMADNFIAHHLDDLKDVVVAWEHALDTFKKEAKSKDWPTGKGSWQHPDVTSFVYEKHWADRLKDFLKHHFKAA